MQWKKLFHNVFFLSMGGGGCTALPNIGGGEEMRSHNLDIIINMIKRNVCAEYNTTRVSIRDYIIINTVFI